MNFEFTKEQLLIKKMVKAFADSKVAPLADGIDEQCNIPRELLAELKKLKIFGIPYDKKYGGAGGSYFEMVLMIEELSKVSAGLGFFMAVHYLGATAINLFGTEEQKKKFLPRLCSGEAIGSFGFTEADTGSDPKAVTCNAKLVDDGYILNGQKRFTTNGSEPGVLVTFAKTETGVSAFAFDKFQEGYSVSKPWEKMGNRGAETVDVYFNDVKLPSDSLLGQEGKGFGILLRGIAIGKLNMSAISLGLGEASLEEAIKYAKQRIVRGKPIATLPTTQALIANALVLNESSRWMLYRATEMASKGLGDIDYESAVTKLYIAKAIKDSIDYSLQVHGCYGYVRDFKVERMYRDIRLMEVIEGASEVQRVIVASNALK